MFKILLALHLLFAIFAMLRLFMLVQSHESGLIVGPRGIAAGTVELKRRSTGEREELSLESALARLTE